MINSKFNNLVGSVRVLIRDEESLKMKKREVKERERGNQLYREKVWF